MTSVKTRIAEKFGFSFFTQERYATRPVHIQTLRKVYHHRALQFTLDNVECLWQELEAFEKT